MRPEAASPLSDPSAAMASFSEPTIGLPPIEEESAAELVPAVVSRVLGKGHRVGGPRPSVEVLNQTLCLMDPRRQILSLPASSFNPAIAVARFVWHLARSSDVAAISFYEPRAQLFSDNGLTLSGSNTGARLFGEGSGCDQARGIVSRLREDPSSRRAMAVVWRPEDAVRQSRDIPCTLAIACHLRGGRLLTTVSMRSNNALRLLPYNLFEFTMLAELIAAELGVEIGSYWHSVNSLHVYIDDLEAAKAVVSSQPAEEAPMPPMPREDPFGQAKLLIEHEATLRSLFARRRGDRLPELLKRAEADLTPYWFGLLLVLALFCAARAGCGRGLEGKLQQIPPALRGPLVGSLNRID